MPETIALSDGTVAVLRPIEKGDDGFLLRAFAELSDESRYTRFLSPTPRLTSEQVRYLTQVDHHDHEALVAASENGEPMGVARYVRADHDSDVAEVAVTVVDRWQGRGLATALLERLAGRAREEGVRHFTATALATNNDMIDVLRRLGETEMHTAGSGLVEMTVLLPTDTHADAPLRRMLRDAAAGELTVRLPARAVRR